MLVVWKLELASHFPTGKVFDILLSRILLRFFGNCRTPEQISWLAIPELIRGIFLGYRALNVLGYRLFSDLYR